jgi:hypothetical protein
LNDVCRMNLEESLVSRILDLDLYSLELSLAVLSPTDLTSCKPNIGHQVEQLIVLYYSLFHPLPRKRVTISGQRFDLYRRIRCRGNVF